MKRFVCFLLAMIMVMGMVPATAVTASAASERTTSDKAVNILKEYEGFAANQYEAGGKYYIGYGTQIVKGSYPNGISKDDALVLLKDHVKDTVDKAINNFAKINNLDLTQYQHDALALFSYNCGTAWMSQDGTFRNAVLQGKSGNEFINAMAQWFGGDPSADNFKGLINRRLSEANMYLNNSYGFYAPSNFTYVILDMDGDEVVEATDKMIAYNSNISQTLATVPTTNAADFLGWYVYDGKVDGKVNGQAVTTLDKDTAGKVLVAKFDNGADDETNFGNADYTINTSSLPSRYVFNKTYTRTELENYKNSMDEEKKGELKKNSEFKVDTEIMVDGVKWIRGVGKDTKNNRLEGWVYFGELPGADSATNTVIATATVISNTLNIREGATADSAKVGELTKGTTVDIYAIKVEPTNTGNQSWGKVKVNGIGGWINLAYTEVKEIVDKSETVDGKTGVIVNAEEVNVRAGAGTNYGKITALKKGTKVTVLETTMNGAAQWGKVRWTGLQDGYTEGWVYMYYVEVSGQEHSNATGGTGNNGTVLYTGVVTSNINLNVRQYADIYAARVKSLPYGTKINIYEVTESRNMKWGRIGDGQWVCLSYVKLTQAAASGNGTSAEGTTSQQGTVTTATLNILKSYNNNAEKIGTLKKGDVVTILEKNTEKTETGSRIWGRIVNNGIEGWINLAYVDLKTVATVAPGIGSSGTTTSVTPTPAVISDCISVNVRQSAGVYSTSITKLNNGTAVTVYEQITYANAPWARIKWNNGANEGWVCMYYVTLNAGTGSTNTDNNGILNGTSSNAISATGYVNNAYLNVRGGAGLGFAQVGTLNQGAKVTIFEQAVADGLIWGRINYNNTTGWVCMSYITVESASSTGKGVMGTIARCFSKANVRSAPGTNNALVATVNVGSRVEVFEIKTHANQQWGRIAQGWICMDYVLLDSELPEGEVLDATTAPTETTKATEPEVTINKDNEVTYVISGTVATSDGSDLNVRNDASAKSDKIGTVKNGEALNVLAVKNNGTELWGRIDQYATAGWVNMAHVSYSVKGYVNTDKQPVYADPNTSSTVKGTLAVNTYFEFKKLTVNGETVYGWYEKDNLAGWIPMGRISKDQVAVEPALPVIKDSSVNCFAISATGKTNAAINAYNVTNGDEVVCKLNAGVTVYVAEINLEAGVVWGKIAFKNNDGVDTAAWINMNSVTYTMAGTVNVDSLNVRTSKSTADDTNILGQLAANTTVQICEISFAADGTPWAKIAGAPDAVLNGGYVALSRLTTTISIAYK